MRAPMPGPNAPSWIFPTSGVLALMATIYASAAADVAQALREGKSTASALIHGLDPIVAKMVEEPSGMTLLHLACQAGDDQSARLLLAQGADPDERSGALEKKFLGSKRFGPTPMIWAASSNSGGCVKALVDAMPMGEQAARAFEAKNGLGETPALTAARLGNIRALTEILNAWPASVDHKNPSRENLAMLACRGGFIDCLRQIDAKAADPNPLWIATSATGQSALSLAIESGNVECVQFFADKARQWRESDDPKRREMARELFNGAPKGRDGPLMQATKLGNDDIFQTLEHETLSNQKDLWTQLLMARECLGQADPHGAPRLFCRLSNLAQILTEATQTRRHLEDASTQKFFKELFEIAQDPKPAPYTPEALQALHAHFRLAASHNPAAFLNALKTCDTHGRGVLHLAAQSGNVLLLKALLDLLPTLRGGGEHPHGLEIDEFSALVNRRDVFGRSPLTIAAAQGDRACCEALLAKLADPALKDRSGWTPFSRALEHGHLELAKRLEFDGAKASRDFSGQSVAFLAAGWVDAPSLAWLLEGADPQELFAPNHDGATLLHAAAASGCPQRLRMALPGSDPNAQNANGATALLAALHVGNLECIKLLLPLTDPSLVDKDGRTPLQTSITKIPDPEQRQAEAAKVALVAQWIDPREKTPLGPRWQKLLGPQALACDARELAKSWARPELEPILASACAAWDAGLAPGQAQRAQTPPFGQPWQDPAEIPASTPPEREPLPSEQAPQIAPRLAAAIRAARAGMAPRPSAARAAKTAKP